MSRTRPTENTSYVYCGLKLFALSFLPLARSSSPGSQPGQGSGLDCQSQATGRISDQEIIPDLRLLQEENSPCNFMYLREFKPEHSQLIGKYDNLSSPLFHDCSLHPAV